jgi:hypothetical protein
VQVDVDHPAELLGLLPGRGHRGAHAGVVDEHVHAPELSDGLLNHSPAVVDVRYVGLDGHATAPVALDAGLRVLEAIGAAGADDDVGSGVGQRVGELHTEAGGGAGDERDLVGEAEGIECAHGLILPYRRQRRRPAGAQASSAGSSRSRTSKDHSSLAVPTAPPSRCWAWPAAKLGLATHAWKSSCACASPRSTIETVLRPRSTT